jgi:hypothetical protein
MDTTESVATAEEAAIWPLPTAESQATLLIRKPQNIVFLKKSD